MNAAYSTLKEINHSLIQMFASSDVVDAMPPKTIARFTKDLRYYGNVYLVKHHEVTLDEGWYEIDEFFRTWFYQNTPEATPRKVKEMMRAMIHLYRFLNQENLISNEVFEAILSMMSYNKTIWEKAYKNEEHEG